MDLDVNNFTDFTREEYIENLSRLNINNHQSLVGKKVYYSQKVYGLHQVIEWNPNKGEYLLEYEGHKFWSNPFRLLITQEN